MRIAMDGTPLLKARTGVGNYTLRLARALEQLDACEDIRFFFGIRRLRYLGLNRRKKATSRQPAAGGTGTTLKDRLIDNLPAGLKQHAQRLAVGLEAGWHCPDLFHATNYVAENTIRPMVVTVHDLSFLRYPETHPEKRLRHLEKEFPRTLARAARIIADSNFTKRELVELLKVPEARITVIHLGVSARFHPFERHAVEAQLRKLKLRAGRYILSVGTLEPRKNMPLLLEAYDRLPESLKKRWPLAIAGLRGWKHAGIAARMEHLARRGQLIWLGYVPDVLLPALYAGAYLFVYPSLYEGFGLPPLEAMACGTPALVCARASLPEVVGDAGLQIDPCSVENMTLALTALLNDPVQRRQLSEKSLQQARNFTWQRCARKTLEVYRNVLYS